jgi:hypothetical protein
MRFDLLILPYSHLVRHHTQNYTNGSYGLLLFLRRGLDNRLACSRELRFSQTLLIHLF